MKCHYYGIPDNISGGISDGVSGDDIGISCGISSTKECSTDESHNTEYE